MIEAHTVLKALYIRRNSSLLNLVSLSKPSNPSITNLLELGAWSVAGSMKMKNRTS